MLIDIKGVNMSNTRKRYLLIFIMTLMVAFFALGCKKEVKVSGVYFNLVEDEQIIMLVGDELDLNNHVEVRPANATNKGFVIESLNSEIVSINNGVLTAKAKGSVQIKVSSLQNPLKQDLMTVVVWESEVTLASPANLRYSKDGQTISFNSVPNAASYTLKINEDVYELGNSTSFKLKSKYFDKLTNVQVRANAPTYTSALKSSEFSQALKLYQVGEAENLIVGNEILAFEKKSQDSVARIYFNGQFESETSEVIKILYDLDAVYAGSKLSIDIEMVLSENFKQEIYQQFGSDVQIFNSSIRSVDVEVVSLPQLKLASGVLEWQKDSLVKGYEVYLGDEKIIDFISENKLDLNVIESLDDNTECVVKIKPVVKDTTVNVASTGVASEINIKKLEDPVVTLSENSVNWEPIENVSAYAFDLILDDSRFESSTDKTFLNMTNYPAGQYVIEVKAVANDTEKSGVHFISSNQTQFVFEKQSKVEGAISNYVLNLSDVDSERVSVLLDKGTASALDISNKVESDGYDCFINLKNMDFTTGEHILTIKKKHDTIEKMLESDEIEIQFIQLEKIGNITVSEGVANVVTGQINENNNAKIEIVTSGTGLNENLIVNAKTYAYNTTNLEASDFLSAGQYESNVFVYGNGSTTFGYRENGEFVSCVSANFEVLDVPTLALVDAGKTELTISNISNANYKVFENNVAKSTQNSNIYSFELENGEKIFAVQAVGDGINYLNSKLSEEISVNKLVAPILLFNRETNVLSFVDENDAGLVASRQLTRNGENFDYGFESALALLDDVEFTLTNLANVKVGDKYYLNSNTTTLRLTKLNVATNAKIENNKLVIETAQEECDLQIKFKFAGGSSEILNSNAGHVLENATYTIPYVYNDNKYTINLVDANHNALINGFLQAFDVEVVLTKDDGSHIDSALQTFENLNLVRIDAQTAISTSDKLIVLAPLNQSNEHGLRVTIGTEEFVSNGQNKLVSALSELNYDYRDGKYNIVLLDDEYNNLVATLGTTSGELQFNIKVKYTHSLLGEECDLDSNYSLEQTLTILKNTSLVRQAQTLKFNNVYPTYVASNYKLLIDGSIEMELNNANAILQDGTFEIGIEKVFENIDVLTQTEIHSVQVVVLNNANNLAVSNKGDELYFTKNPTVSLSSFKDNNAVDNSTYIQFEKAEQAIIQNRKYVITLTAGEVVKNKEFSDNSTVLNFSLDNGEFEGLIGAIEVYAQVLASGQSISAGKVVEIFNSNISDKLNITRVSNNMNLTVVNSLLTWTDQAGALGYEVYKVENGSYIILNNEIIKTSSFNLDMLGVESEIELSVKAIGQNQFTTNSLYAESVKVNKISAPSIGVLDGKVVLTISSKLSEMLRSRDIEIVPHILNEEREKQIDFVQFDVDYDNNTLSIDAFMILNYLGTSEIIGENCKFSFKVGANNQDANNVYYLSSAMSSATLYGLFAPTNIRKTTDENNTVEQIMWKSNLNNLVNELPVAEKYLFKFTYTDGSQQTKEFYSNDAKLVYKNSSGDFVSYGIIAVSQNDEDVSIIAPYGYDIDGDNEVIFGAGQYCISVQAIPNSTDTGVLLASSNYSADFEYEIMPAVELKVEGGLVSWRKQEGATSYTVYVTPNGETDARTFTVENVDAEANIKFNFNLLPNVQGVCKVEVKALSTKDNVLNSEISNPMYVYRLPKAESVHIDDGNLVFNANKYFTSAIVEFFDVTKGFVTYSEIYVNTDFENNVEDLAVENWKDITTETNNKISGVDNFKLYTVKLSEEGIVLAANKDYRVNITLLGNSVWEGANHGFVDSAKFETISNLTATKLSTSVVGVEKGVVTFGAPENRKNNPKLNYVLNKTDNGDFWKNDAIIYKIDLKYGAEETTFYALDYYAFKKEIEKANCSITYNVLTTDYEDLYALAYYTYGGNKLVFDVYFENTINIAQRDYLRYHHTTETNEDGENALVTTLNTSELNNGYNEINISSCSSFTFSITILGGDSKVDETSADMTNPNTIGFLSAFAKNVKTINRYANNEITTKNGKILFNNLAQMNEVTQTNNPVYKFVVKQINSDTNEIFYVYSSTKEEAEQVAELNGDLTATFVEIETIEDDETKLLFDLTKYITEGTYIITLQTLAGKANQEDGDYIINAKLPSSGSMNKIVYKLSETVLNAENGVLKFGQSYTINDGVYIYHNCYEITINDGVADYVFKIDQSSQGVKIDASSHTITYDLPKQIETEEGQTLYLDEYGQYLIKVRAISGTVDGETGTMILNSTYSKLGNEDVNLSVRKTAVAKDVRIENGCLKWVVDNVNNHYRTVVKITYQVDGETYEIYKYSSYISNAHYLAGVYQYHYLTWDDFKDDLELAYREGGYTVSLTVASQTGNLLNSNPTDNIEMNVLQIVSESSIVAKEGILTWGAIENATESTQYRVIISGSSNVEVVVSGPFIDLLNHEQTKTLVAGEYNIQVQAIAGDRDDLNLNADPSLRVGGFIKLAPVDLDGIVIDNGVFKWNAVEQAEKYKVLFTYQDDSLMNCEDTQIVEDASYIPPTGVNGAFTLTIWAIGVDDEKLFNSDAITYISSTVAPKGVLDFAYDSVLNNRFIIEVSDDFTNSDKIVIRYNLKKYVQGDATENLGEQSYEIKYVQGQTTYYYDIAVMGIYTNISAQVYRQESVPSEIFFIPIEQINMNLFDHGEGTENNPYVICNAEQLMNIKYYSTRDAYFTLGAAINFENVEIEEIVKENGGFLISETFNGKLSGGSASQKFTIYGFNPERQRDDTILESISLQDQHSFALFGSLNGAIISNINFGDQNTTLKLTNSFALDNLDMISLSWMATEAIDSTIDDVNLDYRTVNIEIVLNKSAENTADEIEHDGFKIAALFANAENTTIKNLHLNVNIAITTNAQNLASKRGKGVYIAGVVAHANNCTLEENLNVTFALSGSKKLYINYAGGIYAYFTADDSKSINTTEVNVNVNDVRIGQFGGIVGYAKKLNVADSSVCGTYILTEVNYDFTVGGIVGEASDVNITNCSSFVDFNIAITVVMQSKQNLGIIAGNIYKNAIASSIKNCSSHLFGDTIINQTTISSSGEITLGVYGRNKDATIEGCKKATKT